MTLNDTLGQPVIGLSSGGSATLRAGCRPCNLPAAVSNVVATKLNSTDVRPTWTGTGLYDVWQGISPYFLPGEAGSAQIGDDMTSPFTAAGVLGDPAVNYSFLELAWRGYLTPRLDSLGVRVGASSMLVGVIWGTWHVPYWSGSWRLSTSRRTPP